MRYVPLFWAVVMVPVGVTADVPITVAAGIFNFFLFLRAGEDEMSGLTQMSGRYVRTY